MKALNFLAVLVMFLLNSCGGEEYYSVTVENNSSKPVSYVYNGYQDTLAVSESKWYEAKAYTWQPLSVTVPGALSVKMEHTKDVFVFQDIDPFKLHIANTLPVSVTVQTYNNYISFRENISDEESVTITVPAQGTKSGDLCLIYTSKPLFFFLPEPEAAKEKPEAGYPAVISWELVGDTIYAVIK